MSKFKLIFPLLAVLLFLSGIIFPVRAQGTPPPIGSAQVGLSSPIHVIVNQDCFALSNEPPGDLISKLVLAGYGNHNLYQVLVAMANSDPSVAAILTDPFMATLAHEPAGNEIFTTQLKTMDTPGITVEMCTDGGIQTVPVSGFSSTAQGFPTLVSSILGVKDINFTHSSADLGNIATFEFSDYPLVGMETIYHVFGVAWGKAQPATIYLPLVIK